MENVTVFFCDISGTFASGLNLRINEFELMRFVNNLHTLKKRNGSNEFLFSFVSAENIEVVSSMEKRLKENIKTTEINVGNHLYDDGRGGSLDKASYILKYIKRLDNLYIIDQIYYADDCEFYHYMLHELRPMHDVSHSIHSIIPIGQGMIDVNNIIEDSFIIPNQYKIGTMR